MHNTECNPAEYQANMPFLESQCPNADAVLAAEEVSAADLRLIDSFAALSRAERREMLALTARGLCGNQLRR